MQSKLRLRWLLLIVAVLAGALGFLAQRYLVPKNAVPASADAALPRLLALPLRDLQGQSVTLAKWQGKPVLVNFWATWCPPCREEMPLLRQVAAKSPDVQFVGVAYDDLPQVQKYAAENPGFYPFVVAGSEISNLFPQLGNSAQGLPFTLLIGADGKVKRVKLGPFRGDELSLMLAALRS